MCLVVVPLNTRSHAILTKNFQTPPLKTDILPRTTEMPLLHFVGTLHTLNLCLQDDCCDKHVQFFKYM